MVLAQHCWLPCEAWLIVWLLIASLTVEPDWDPWISFEKRAAHCWIQNSSVTLCISTSLFGALLVHMTLFLIIYNISTSTNSASGGAVIRWLCFIERTLRPVFLSWQPWDSTSAIEIVKLLFLWWPYACMQVGKGRTASGTQQIEALLYWKKEQEHSCSHPVSIL